MIEVLGKTDNQPIHQWVYHTLRMNIITLKLEPGSTISEPEVAKALGTSRTPVREAFIRLVKDGLLVVNPQRRSRISAIDLTQAEEARFIRSAIEKSVLKEACASFPGPVLGEMRRNLDAQLALLRANTPAGLLALDNDFHRLLYGGCRKERVWAYIKGLDFNFDRLRVIVIPHVMETVIGEHERIFEIVTNGEGPAVDEIVDRHVTWKNIDRILHEYPDRFFTSPIAGRAQELQTGPAGGSGLRT